MTDQPPRSDHAMHDADKPRHEHRAEQEAAAKKDVEGYYGKATHGMKDHDRQHPTQR